MSLQQQPSPYTAPPPVVSLEKVENMRRGNMAHLFLVGDTTLDEPHERVCAVSRPFFGGFG